MIRKIATYIFYPSITDGIASNVIFIFIQLELKFVKIQEITGVNHWREKLQMKMKRNQVICYFVRI